MFYRQIAVIKHEDTFFYILSPLIVIEEGFDDNLALAYTCDEEALVAATNEEDQCREIFSKYYELFACHKYGEVSNDGSILKSEIVYTCYTFENDKELCDYITASI